MKQTYETISKPHNIGPLDTAVRLALAGGGLYALTLGAGQVSAWNSVLALLAVYPLVTAICRWDPLYDFAGIRTRRGQFHESQLLAETVGTRSAARERGAENRRAA